MPDRGLDADLARAARSGLLIGMWIAAAALVAYLVIGGAQFGLDSHAYWRAIRVDHPYGAEPGTPDAYLYSPLFLQLIWPLAVAPWPAFVVAWTLIQVGVVWWLTAPLRLRWRIPLMLLCTPEFVLGNVHALLAGCLVLGFARPAWWGFLALTKVEPGAVAGLWLAAAGQWRRLLAFGAWTAAVTSVSVVAAPQLWAEWVAFLVRPHELTLYFWARLALSVAVAVIAARKDWIWALPVAVLLAIPTDGLGISGIVLMAAIPRLIRSSSRGVPGEPIGPASTVHSGEFLKRP